MEWVYILIINCVVMLIEDTLTVHVNEKEREEYKDVEGGRERLKH